LFEVSICGEIVNTRICFVCSKRLTSLSKLRCKVKFVFPVLIVNLPDWSPSVFPFFNLTKRKIVVTVVVVVVVVDDDDDDDNDDDYDVVIVVVVVGLNGIVFVVIVAATAVDDDDDDVTATVMFSTCIHRCYLLIVLVDFVAFNIILIFIVMYCY